VPTEMRIFQLWTARDGRVVRMEMFHDLDEARRAAGLE
jgi:ketosteroid isomerase-like protein